MTHEHQKHMDSLREQLDTPMVAADNINRRYPDGQTTRTFDTSTLKGLKEAERFKAKMENLYESVNVYAIGLNRVQIVALRRN